MSMAKTRLSNGAQRMRARGEAEERSPSPSAVFGSWSDSPGLLVAGFFEIVWATLLKFTDSFTRLGEPDALCRPPDSLRSQYTPFVRRD